MTRGVLLAWLGAGVIALAIVAALFWPLDASVAPLPAAEASVASPSAVPAPLERAATSDARGRSVRKPNQTPAAVASAAPPRRRNPASVPVPLKEGSTDDGNDGSRGRPDSGEFSDG